MSFFEDEYEYGTDDDIDKRLRYILRVDPYFEDDYRERYNRGPRREEINQEYSRRSVRGDFDWLTHASREELDILHEKRERKYREEQQNYSSDVGFWGALGALAGLVGGLMFEEVEEDDYEDEDDF
jgi:hypothetical protein